MPVETTKFTPAVKRLFMERWSQLMVDRAGNAEGGKVCAVAARIVENQGASLKSDMQEAWEWTKQAIKLVRAAPDAHFDSDEAAAIAIMERIDARKAQCQ